MATGGAVASERVEIPSGFIQLVCRTPEVCVCDTKSICGDVHLEALESMTLSELSVHLQCDVEVTWLEFVTSTNSYERCFLRRKVVTLLSDSVQDYVTSRSAALTSGRHVIPFDFPMTLRDAWPVTLALPAQSAQTIRECQASVTWSLLLRVGLDPQTTHSCSLVVAVRQPCARQWAAVQAQNTVEQRTTGSESMLLKRMCCLSVGRIDWNIRFRRKTQRTQDMLQWWLDINNRSFVSIEAMRVTLFISVTFNERHVRGKSCDQNTAGEKCQRFSVLFPLHMKKYPGVPRRSSATRLIEFDLKPTFYNPFMLPSQSIPFAFETHYVVDVTLVLSRHVDTATQASTTFRFAVADWSGLVGQATEGGASTVDDAMLGISSPTPTRRYETV